jgi:Zn-finger nucleic acid-binding protein
MPLGCPVCSGCSMTPIKDPEISLEIDFCPFCRGLWFDNEEIRSFIKSRKFRELFLAEKERRKIIPLTADHLKARSCPRCLRKMEERTHCDVAFDFCTTCHGIWLDDGEINQIIESYRKSHTAGEEMILDELRAGLKSEGFNIAELLNIIANFFKDFFEHLKTEKK